jgi:multiple sugar transport system substrate-binding protein
MNSILKWQIILFTCLSVVFFSFYGCAEPVVEEPVEEEPLEEEPVEEEPVEEEPVEEEEILISYPHWFFGIGGDIQEVWDNRVEQYEEMHPNIKIDGYNITPDVYTDQISTMIAGGNPPDVMQLWPAWFTRFTSEGVLLPLDDYLDLEEAMEGYNQLQTEIIPSIAPDGKTYGMITWITIALPWYRPSVLEAAGVDEIPTTFEEYETMLEEVSDGRTMFGMGAAFEPGNWNEGLFDVIWWLYALGGDYVDEEGVPDLNNEKVIETLTLLKEWYDSGYMPKDVTMSDKRRLMAAGNIGSMLGIPIEYSVANTLADEPIPHDDYFAAAWPMPSPYLTTLVQTTGISIDTKHPKEVAEFVAWWGNLENSKDMILKASSLMPRTDLADDSAFMNQVELEAPHMVPFLEAMIDPDVQQKLQVPVPLLRKNADEVNRVWYSYIESVIYQNVDPKEAMDSAQEEALLVYE